MQGRWMEESIVAHPESEKAVLHVSALVPRIGTQSFAKAIRLAALLSCVGTARVGWSEMKIERKQPTAARHVGSAGFREETWEPVFGGGEGTRTPVQNAARLPG